MAEQYEADILMVEILSDPTFNCRGFDITPGSVMDLAEDIKSNPGGLLQRIILQPWTDPAKPKIKFRVVAGNRRYTACKMLKWTSIPSKVIVGLTQEQAEDINLAENIKRRDLNILQEAKAIDRMRARGQSASAIGKRLDVNATWVKARLGLLSLPEDVQYEAAAGLIKQSHIMQLVELRLVNIDKMYEAVRTIKNSADTRRKIVVKKSDAEKLNTTPQREFRNMSDVFKIQDLIQDAIGTNLGAKALAWVIGEVSVYDFLIEVKREADLLGLPWSIPDEFKPEKK